MFTHLRFDNDIVMASHDLKELQTMGLEMNIKKSQVMFNEQIDGESEVKIDQT